MNNSWKEKSPLELVHYNIFRAMQEESLGKNIYFLTFIDDFSCHMWAYFLKHKYEALGCFKNFIAMVEKQSGYSIKILRIDRWGEFISKEFADFYDMHGIQRQLTKTFTPK